MRIRHLVALGAVFGAFGASDLPRVQAQSSKSQVRFVRILLLKESRDIANVSVQVARYYGTQFQIAQLDQRLATDSSRQLRRDIRQLSGLEARSAQFLGTASALALKLSTEDFQTLVAVNSLPPTTPNLAQLTFQADSNNLTIRGILASPPFGITPVTPTS